MTKLPDRKGDNRVSHSAVALILGCYGLSDFSWPSTFRKRSRLKCRWFLREGFYINRHRVELCPHSLHILRYGLVEHCGVNLGCDYLTLVGTTKYGNRCNSLNISLL